MAKKSSKRKINWLRLFIFILTLLFFLGTGAAMWLVAVSIKDLPPFNERNLYTSATTLIYDQKDKLVARIGTENREPVEIKDIPLYVQQAFIAIEDARFYQHHGIDLRGIARATWYNLINRSFEQGASTITQQLVKLSFLSPERTLKRKIQEIILSLIVERRYSKEAILQMYLNKIYFGKGAYGIQSAARTYFGKNVNDLTLSQAAFLAGLPKAPNLYSQEEKAEARRNLVLDAMARYDFISPEELVIAKEEPLIFEEANPGTCYYHPYFVDYVVKELINRYGEDMVYKGGLRVYTSLDKNIQEALEKAMANPKNFPASIRDSNEILQPEGAAVFLDPQTGYIKAIVGGREHKGSLTLNRATEAQRQPGSAFKPIIAFAPAIEFNGMSPASVIDDIPVKFGSYSPRNYDGTYRGLVTMRNALTYSINVVAVRTLMEHVGISKAIEFASRLGISLAPEDNGPSMALGGLHRGVTPLQMAAAYAAFANDGIYVQPAAIRKVETLDGRIFEEHQPQSARAMKASTAYLITDMLKDVIRKGTGKRARLSRPAAGKTGTSEKGKDLWFTGYTPELVGVVWIGYDKPKPMPYEYGGHYPAIIWRQVMNEALKNTPVSNFPKPPDIVTATVDNKSGLLPGPNTPPEHMVTDLFAAGTIPTKTDNTHVLVEICPVTGLLASENCPERITKIMIKLPYTVPSYVKDYRLRAPVKICNLHTEKSSVPPQNTQKSTEEEEEEELSKPDKKEEDIKNNLSKREGESLPN